MTAPVIPAAAVELARRDFGNHYGWDVSDDEVTFILSASLSVLVEAIAGAVEAERDLLHTAFPIGLDDSGKPFWIWDAPYNEAVAIVRAFGRAAG